MFTRVKNWAYQQAVFSVNQGIRKGVSSLAGTKTERTVDIAMFLLIYAVYTIASWVDSSLSMFQLVFFIPATAGATLLVHKLILKGQEEDINGTP